MFTKTSIFSGLKPSLCEDGRPTHRKRLCVQKYPPMCGQDHLTTIDSHQKNASELWDHSVQTRKLQFLLEFFWLSRTTDFTTCTASSTQIHPSVPLCRPPLSRRRLWDCWLLHPHLQSLFSHEGLQQWHRCVSASGSRSLHLYMSGVFKGWGSEPPPSENKDHCPPHKNGQQ